MSLETLTINDLAKLREIILDVIDDREWLFDEDRIANVKDILLSDAEIIANENRLRFCDAIQGRIQDTWEK